MFPLLLLFSCLGVDSDISQGPKGDLVAVVFEREGGLRYVLSSFTEPIAMVEVVTACGARDDAWCMAACKIRLSPGWSQTEVHVAVTHLKGPATLRLTLDVVCPEGNYWDMPFLHVYDKNTPFFEAYDAAGVELGLVRVGPMR